MCDGATAFDAIHEAAPIDYIKGTYNVNRRGVECWGVGDIHKSQLSGLVGRDKASHVHFERVGPKCMDGAMLI